jgi:hypothetical protein
MADKPYIDTSNYSEASEYKKLSNIDIYIPETGITVPKDSDYKRGYFYRYFYQQSNNKQGKVKEITDGEYNNLKSEYLYRTLKIKWKIIGEKENAKNINRKVTETADKVLPGIKNVLSRDYLEFWKNIPDKLTQFDVTNKLPKSPIKKKRFNVDLVAEVLFDERGFVYILTEDLDIIYTEDAIGILAQLV